MGYYTTLTGSLLLSSIPSFEVWDKIHNLDSLYFMAEQETPMTFIDFGDLSGKFYNLEGDIKSLVGTLSEVGITVQGAIECVGEEQPDIWRLVVDNGTVTRETARMLWPDGSEYR